MKKVNVHSRCKKMLADIYTPVSIYLRIRDKFPGSILMESADFSSAENSYSFIAINPIGGIEVTSINEFEFKYPGEKEEKHQLNSREEVLEKLDQFLKSFHYEEAPPVPMAAGLFGYTSYDAVQFFDTLHFRQKEEGNEHIPLMRYRFYQYVIAINHFKDELYLCENQVKGLDSDFELLESLIKNKDCPQYPFTLDGQEKSNISGDEYKEMVNKGKQHCQRGDVFQIVLSRNFTQSFKGDEFNAYRALRSINPSPYLFYFDYSDYKLMGSSPEAQLIINNGKATIHPIAGTFKRTGDVDKDKELAEKLLKDPKENAEHVMLVDLARNDLSRYARNVQVETYRKVHYFSHVIHLVSEVTGELKEKINPFALLAATFPAGTLSGAPKFKAMELIDKYEKTSRGFYGGCIGFVGFNGDFNQAIMIRSMLSKDNVLHYQAGAGIVVHSQPESELQEVNNKLNALKQAVITAQTII